MVKREKVVAALAKAEPFEVVFDSATQKFVSWDFINLLYMLREELIELGACDLTAVDRLIEQLGVLDSQQVRP
jgi:hypothetical protein